MLLLAMVVLMVPATARPAQAAGLALSLDGRRWSGSIDRALFAADRVWVPGDRTTVTFFVRNDSGELADLRIDVLDARGTLVLGRDVLLSVRIDGEAADFGGRLVARRGIDGRPRRVDLTARMPASAGNETQLRSVDLRLRVTLQGVVTSIPSEPSRGPLDRLGATGGPGGVLAGVALGLVLLGVGTSLICLRRPS